MTVIARDEALSTVATIDSLVAPAMIARADRDARIRRLAGRVRPVPARLMSDALSVGIAGTTVGMAPLTTAGFIALVVPALMVFRTYRRRLALSALDDLPGIAGAIGLAVLVIALMLGGDPRADHLLALSGITFALVLIARTMTYWAVGHARIISRGRAAVIVGSGPIARELSDHLSADLRFGLRPVGFVENLPADDDLNPLGHLDELERMSRELGVTDVVVAYGPSNDSDLVPVLRAAGVLGLELYVVPRFFELGASSTGNDVEPIVGIPLHRMRAAAAQRWSWRSKRLIDFTVALIGLTILSPIMGIIALLVRWSSAGPVFFAQERVGQFGRSITVYKFRTMPVNTDGDTTWAVDRDPRLTPVGAWLRRLSLDELPQLWNVLVGDMSLVGPRPERPFYVDRFSARVRGYDDRLRLPAGLTGLAQVSGLRGDTSIDRRARFDNAYIEHWSPWLDLKVALRTVVAVVRDGLQTHGTATDPEGVGSDLADGSRR